jgi:hypothetical protein
MGILLAGKAVDTYVIRFSGQQPGFFTISARTAKDIQSYRIRSDSSVSSSPTLVIFIVSLTR